MNHNNSPFQTPNYPPSSSVSEFDSLSDSDWLDVSSNRESDDNDSVVSEGSERDEIGLMPLSRRSSMSVGSSREGDVEAWEGFVDESEDEDVRSIEHHMAVTSPTAHETEDVSDKVGPIADIDQDVAEEQRVKEALDQSLISTLSASRSSSGSTHNSLRDLRLSFPDPITSSRDELNRSYDDVSPSETTFTAADDGDITTETPSVPLRTEDPGSLTTIPEVLYRETHVHTEVNSAEFEVILYGCTSSIKWTFAEELVRKLMTMPGSSLISNFRHDDATRWLNFEHTVSDSVRLRKLVVVHDRTEGILTRSEAPALQVPVERPSLAIVYLPAMLHSLPEHTLYLPVLVPSAPSTKSDGIDEAVHSAAYDDWDLLSIPADKTANLKGDSFSLIFDSRNIDHIEQLRAHKLLQSLIAPAKRPGKSISEHLSSVHAVTLLALLSLIVGFAFNTAFRAPSSATPTAATPMPNSFRRVSGPEINHTVVIPITTQVNRPSTPPVARDSSVSVSNMGSPSSAVTPQGSPSVSSLFTTPKPVASIGSILSVWTDKTKLGTDVIVRPTTQLSIDTKPSMSMKSLERTVDGPPSEKSTALGFRVVDSLSEVLNIGVKALVENARTDLDELLESLDELAHAIARQTQNAMQQSLGKAKVIRGRVQYRNDRARGKAKELKRKGEQLILFAGEQFKGRTDIAKKRARDIRQSLVASEAWRGYQKAHEEWAVKLKERSSSMERTRGWRCKRSQTKREKVDRRKAVGFFSCA